MDYKTDMIDWYTDIHQDDMFVKCIKPNTTLLYSLTGVYRGIPIFLIACGYSLRGEVVLTCTNTTVLNEIFKV